MGYKYIKPALTTMDNIAKTCGLFTTDHWNGYGCESKSKEKDGNACASWNCPLCNCADMSDLKEQDIDLYNEYLPDYKEHGHPDIAEEDFEIADWVVQYREVTRRKT